MKLQMRPISEIRPSDLPVLAYQDSDSYPVGMSAASAHQLGQIVGGPKYWAPLPEVGLPAPPPPPAPLPKMFCWVRYRLRQSGAICPATITRINDDGTVGIAAFPHFGFGSIITDAAVPYGTEPGQWSYPEEAACPAQPEV